MSSLRYGIGLEQERQNVGDSSQVAQFVLQSTQESVSKNWPSGHGHLPNTSSQGSQSDPSQILGRGQRNVFPVTSTV